MQSTTHNTARSSVRRSTTVSRMTATGVVAIMRHTEATLAIDAAHALLLGGVDVVEVTLNTAGALEMIAALSEKYRGKMVVGAGTVLTPDAVRAAVDAGAEFVVAPNTDHTVIAEASRLEIPSVPGALTPTEIVTAWNAGADLVKLFPASSGGARYLRDIRGPLNTIPIVPTGGVNPSNVAEFIRAGAVAVGAGSDLVDRGVVERRDWVELTRRAQAFVDGVRAGRSTE